MTRMAGPDCAVMCNLINRHNTYIHTYTHIALHTHTYQYFIRKYQAIHVDFWEYSYQSVWVVILVLSLSENSKNFMVPWT